jgi:hypothetical protein
MTTARAPLKAANRCRYERMMRRRRWNWRLSRYIECPMCGGEVERGTDHGHYF